MLKQLALATVAATAIVAITFYLTERTVLKHLASASTVVMALPYISLN